MAPLVYVFLFGAIARDTFGGPLLPPDHQPFIVGGQDAPEAYAPYMAALIFGGRVLSHWCGGSIISKSLILTAAHCVEPFELDDGTLSNSLHGRVGSNQWNSGGTIIHFKDHHMHPKWDSNNIKNDVAVLELTKDVILSKTLAIIRLSFELMEENEECFVAGWGRTGPRIEGTIINLQPTPDSLQILYMNTLAHKPCQTLMQAVSSGRAPNIDEHVEVCTFHSRGHGMCHGDSGSALVRRSTREQAGLVSWGYSCALGAPDVHVSLSGTDIKNFVKGFLHRSD
ncbi:hypothetical protein PYW08_011530 [Mythimna loreyi]|uniref:Uncharacterized protein n=1 Tax=Mythimna loreyi TaxID=667449 RepID=A0ACC2QJN6_9NEOP|nr:hypothetical protein PYW08_011530 [Mythimna loreyi]